ncbi:MAG: V-type ATP synthase subunit E family protein [Ruminococcus sp.]|nr:V-type ATP synthase subunit E family protein [Ruminococcus sp.]
MSDYKSSNFLNAIKKFNEEERAKVVSEMENKRAEAVKDAEAKGREEADKYIKKHLSAAKSEITGKYAVKTLEVQGEVFKTRDKMVDEVFERCAQKLGDFSATSEYRDKLLGFAKEIADTFNNNSCIVYVKADDLKYENDIKSVFAGEAEVRSDVTIRIGGIKGFCEAMNIVADNTLDSKLESKRQWFVENIDLKLIHK